VIDRDDVAEEDRHLTHRRGLIALAIGAAVAPLAGFPAAAASSAPQPLPVEEIAPGVYVHHGVHELLSESNAGAIANVGFVVGETSVAVVDSGGSPVEGARLLAAIRKVTPLPVTHVINTHMHPDHVLGNQAFRADGVIFAGHRNLAAALAARTASYIEANARLLGPELGKGLEIVQPTMPVDGETVIDLGGRRLVLTAWPTAHTDNDLTVFDEKTRTLFTGDLLFVEHLPVIDGKLTGWFQVMDRLAQIPAARAVPGHGHTTTEWPGGMADQRRYLETLAADLRAVIARGGTLDEAVAGAGQSERSRWVLFDDFNARNATAGFAELEWE
jgi:quinoprotein relay system zinc metallohydrolase 2